MTNWNNIFCWSKERKSIKYLQHFIIIYTLYPRSNIECISCITTSSNPMKILTLEMIRTKNNMVVIEKFIWETKVIFF